MQDKPSFCEMTEPHVGLPGEIIKMQHTQLEKSGPVSSASSLGVVGPTEFPYRYLKPGPETNSPDSFITLSGSPSQVREPT